MTLVYRDLDQAALDFQYNNQAQVADPKRYLDWYRPASENARAKVDHVANVAYGPLPDERLDIFKPTDAQQSDRRPVVIFVHGGAWRQLDLSSSGFAAETFTDRGALYVPVGFASMPAAGTLDEMIAQVRTAIAWTWNNIAAYGGDRDRLYVVGHSSGAHLAAMGAVTDWQRLFGLPAEVVAATALVSGMYDLEPVRLSYRNEMLRLDRAAELRNSPCRNLPSHGPAILVAYGGLETSEFKRQARSFAELWHRRFGNGRQLEVEGKNHYQLIETLTDSSSVLVKAVMALFEI